MKFADLRLVEPILRAVVQEGYTIATPIQAQTIPLILEGGDVLGCAQTGTGKTAAFALPVLHRLAEAANTHARDRKPRCLVLCPTRELASQIAESFETYGRNLHLKTTVIFGGVNQNPQVAALRRSLDILVATPGRLLDLYNQGHVDLSQVQTLILDEADRMLDMGFIHDINRIVDKLPTKRQTLLFSATMPSIIRQLANRLLHKPTTVQVAAESTTADRIEQWVYHVPRTNKPQLLTHLAQSMSMSRAIVFTRTKHGADKVVRHLRRSGTEAEAIHGNKSQNARQRALDGFRDGRVHMLVATDVASRGIDVDGISHVINYDLPNDPESYVHRIGRTARAGASGIAMSFCDHDERSYLTAIQRLIRIDIPVRDDHPDYRAMLAAAPVERETRNQPAQATGNSRGRKPSGGTSKGPRRGPATGNGAGNGTPTVSANAGTGPSRRRRNRQRAAV